MFNVFVNAEIGLKEATDWSSTKISNISKQTMRSRYQSIDKKSIQVHVKLEGRLSIQVWRKKRFKKMGLFARCGSVLLAPLVWAEFDLGGVGKDT
jgi:hypothetical protein